MLTEKKSQAKIRTIHVGTCGCCNNNCVFCGDRENERGGFSSADFFFSLYKKPFLVQRGFKRFCRQQKGSLNILFTSGEPTLNPNLFDFIKAAKKYGYRNIGLQTNGRRLSYKPFCTELVKSGVNEVSVSIHGSCDKIHDSLTRSPGSFKQTMQGLRNLTLIKQAYPLKIITTFTITKINYHDVYFYIKLMMSLKKVDRIVLNTLMYTGNAKKKISQIFVSYSDITEEFKKSIDKNKEEGYDMSTISLSPIPLCLMRGYEQYTGRFEDPFQIKKGKVRKLNRDSQQIKTKKCIKCSHRFICDGLDAAYYEKIGSFELKPF